MTDDPRYDRAMRWVTFPLLILIVAVVVAAVWGVLPWLTVAKVTGTAVLLWLLGAVLAASAWGPKKARR